MCLEKPREFRRPARTHLVILAHQGNVIAVCHPQRSVPVTHKPSMFREGMNRDPRVTKTPRNLKLLVLRGGIPDNHTKLNALLDEETTKSSCQALSPIICWNANTKPRHNQLLVADRRKKIAIYPRMRR